MSAELIERFYAAFDRRDGAAMAALYAPDATFTDPVFGRLEGEQPGVMWQMLTGRADDLRVELVEHEGDERTGSARWIARYTFTQTGRPVVNDVTSTFRFADDDLIREQVDRFGFYAWARQALGTRGALLGWMPQTRLSVQRQARAGLDRWMQQRDGAAPSGS
jgi:ketosteroid isomerase-like protein